MAPQNDGAAGHDYRWMTACHFLRRKTADFGYD